MANIVSELNQVRDILAEVAGLVPRVQDELEVKAEPSQLKTETEKAVVRVSARLAVQNDFCRDAVDALIDELTTRSTQLLLNIIPLPRMAWLAQRHAFTLGEPARAEAFAELQGFLRSAINKIASLGISNAQLDGILARAQAKLCAVNQRGAVPLQPTAPTFLSTSPASAGTFLNLQEESIDFYCSLNTRGAVTIRAQRACGLGDAGGNVHLLRGEGSLTCFGESCTEDALGSLVIFWTFQPLLQRSSPCGFVKELLDTQVVDVFITNTHESRTIALAAVAIIESDKRKLPRGPCENPVAFGGSVSACLEVVAAGCDSPLGLFLRPGQTTSIPYTFNCRLESIFQPPDTLTCGQAQLETEKGHLLVQAVFCDDFDTAQQVFCRNVDQQMKLLGFPAPEFPSTEVRPCP
jgi:hypothetical protein